MAGAQSTVFSLGTPLNNPTTRRTYPLLVVSSISTARSSKLRQRKNHLRLKILKTLRKPHLPNTPPLPQEPPPLPSTTQKQDLRVEIPAEQTNDENGGVVSIEGDELEKIPVSETVGVSGEYNDFAGKLSAGSILKYGAYLVGVFMFQTICSVWVMSNSISEQKAGDSVMGNMEIDERGKGESLPYVNGKALRGSKGSHALYPDYQSEMEKKIEEIRAMAREARRIEEKKEEEAGNPEIGDEDAIYSHRLDIEKEINARLEKLQSKMNSSRDKSKASHVNQLGTSVKSGDSLNVNQGKERLMFEKKLKYRSPSSTNSAKISKGFQGKAPIAKTRGSASKGTTKENGTAATDSMQTLYKNKKVNIEDIEERDSRLSLEDGGNLVREESKPLLMNGKNLVEEINRPNGETERGAKSNEVSSDGLQETSFGRSTLEVKQSRKSRESEMENFKGSVEDNQDGSSGFEKDDLRSINRSPKHGLAEKISAANGVKAKPANTETDMWWTKLRHVLVILMRREHGEEGARAIYSLKVTSQEQDQSVYSYTVAFEDEADANNFCFLLESFFEDLGDFCADVFPLSTQELEEAVKSHAKKVIVVKKKQLQLYAGQPLADVEMALCSLIGKDQNLRPIDLI
ncbi:hypothetical protein L6164_012541 [Bauhinia variegata]|uniref:Uncharacterized protein n=1 Tax=Bauhinia variegata TaxID=167791 RepID=A0ACB9PBW0_BAUVA|nr:hypothetical protein L6164_012541 [Bauhinia variegata]